MSNPILSKNFIFNEKIDADYLFSLYADDYPYVEEVLFITLQHFDQDLETFQLAWASEDLPDLKRAIHKMKPAFGFAGMLTVQQECMDFEEKCQAAAGTSELKAEYKSILTTLTEGKSVIESEHRRLKEFNANPI